MKITSTKFYENYLFIIRVIRSCKTKEQLKSASQLSWNFINNNISWQQDIYKYLKLICNELDTKRQILTPLQSEVL